MPDERVDEDVAVVAKALRLLGSTDFTADEKAARDADAALDRLQARLEAAEAGWDRLCRLHELAETERDKAETERDKAREALRWIAYEGGKQGCGYREAEEVARAALAAHEGETFC